jgi:peptidoglycan/xylan/chitin deacetylase (PgdA/CDA1 family)
MEITESHPRSGRDRVSSARASRACVSSVVSRAALAAAVVAACLGQARAGWAEGETPQRPRAAGARGRPKADFPRFLRPLPGAPGGAQRSTTSWGRSLLLSFDDGPDLVGTSLILDELTRRHAKAVFFVNAHHIVRNRPEDLARRDLLRKLATHGHLVGNHTMNHKNLCQERDAMAAEIDGASELITYSTSVRPLLFRSPYGARCRDLDRALADRDLIQVGWNMDPQEWRGEDEDAIVKYTIAGLRRAQGPVILLLHDKNVAAVRALSRILDFVDAENARAAAEGKPPIRLVDYRVFLPAERLPETGLEPWGQSFLSSLGVLRSLGDLTSPLR